MKTISASVGVLTFLLGCAPVDISTPPVMITPKIASNASGIDVYARERANGNPVPLFRGQKTVQIRAMGATESAGFAELSGVPCDIDSGVYYAKISTPANLIVPDYGASSPAIFVRCTYNGKMGSATVNAFNKTNADLQGSAAGTGLLGAIIIGAVAANKRNDSVDDFQYPPITVQVK